MKGKTALIIGVCVIIIIIMLSLLFYFWLGPKIALRNVKVSQIGRASCRERV